MCTLPLTPRASSLLGDSTTVRRQLSRIPFLPLPGVARRNVVELHFNRVQESGVYMLYIFFTVFYVRGMRVMHCLAPR